MKQTRKASLVEALINVAVGFSINMAIQFAIFAYFGVHLPLHQNFVIGLIFTVVSICRSYLLRRAFEALRVKGILP